MNFNLPMCKAAKVTIVEAEEIVEPGEIAPYSVRNRLSVDCSSTQESNSFDGGVTSQKCRDKSQSAVRLVCSDNFNITSKQISDPYTIYLLWQTGSREKLQETAWESDLPGREK